jgi:hypothetical protein
MSATIKMQSTIWLMSVLAGGGCARAPARVGVSPEYAVVQACASSIAHSENFQGFAFPDAAPGTANSPRQENFTGGESLRLRVRTTTDSILPQAIINSATSTGRASAPISPEGHRVQSRINNECRFPRSAASR